MRAISLCFAAIALTSISPANAQEEQNTRKPHPHLRRGETASRQARDQTPLQIFCRRDVPCRPVKKGCHLEPGTGMGGLNEEICN